MNEYDVKRLALTLAVNTEVIAMTIANAAAAAQKERLPYNEGDFQQKAEELRRLAYMHNEQL